jgi:hypothetical protein
MVVILGVLDDIREKVILVENWLTLWFRKTSDWGGPPFCGYPWVDVIQVHPAESEQESGNRPENTI